MKNCPSCNAACGPALEVCPVCGHAFDVGTPKRTMMGFPSLAAALEEAEQAPPQDPAKQTLFGFPAQKAFGVEDSVAAQKDEDDDGASATAIIPASAFAFDGEQLSVQPQEFEEAAPTLEADLRGTINDLRGTVAGMPLPAEVAGDATEIVSGTAVFPGMRIADDAEAEADEIRQHGTLMGMSLADVQAQAPISSNRTEFAMPAVQFEKAAETANLETGKIETSLLDPNTANYDPKTANLPSDSEGLDDDSDSIDDSPTQAWSPGAALSLGKPKFDPDGRKKLLEKIRKSRPVVGNAGSTADPQSVARDGPDLSALKKLSPKRELVPTPARFPDERDTNEQAKAPPAKSSAPASGVLRPANKPRRPRSDAQAGGFSFGQNDSPAPIADSLGESISDPDFGLMETGIASGEMLEQAAASLAISPGDRADDAAFPSPPSVSPATQQQFKTQSKGVYETFDGGMSPHASSQSAPANKPIVPARQPAPPALQNKQTVPTAAVKPAAVAPKPAPARPTARPYQPASGGPTAQPVLPLQPAGAPYLPGSPTMATGEDGLVRNIQAGFGILAGGITFAIQITIFMGGGLTTPGIALVALAFTLAIASVAAAIFPLGAKLRSITFFAVAIALAMCFLLGIIFGLPKIFLVIGLAALLAAVAGAFPQLTRYL